MAIFSRYSPQESRAADKVLDLVRMHDGVAFCDLIGQYPDRLRNGSSVLAAISLLLEERKLVSDRPSKSFGQLQSVKLYAVV